MRRIRRTVLYREREQKKKRGENMEKKSIHTTAIVGMGALGMLFGEHIQRTVGREHLAFVMDSRRFSKHKADVYQINGERQEFTLVDVAEAKPVDLVIVATKYNGLHQALDVMEPLIGENTVIISVMNGISSEEIIARRYGDINLLYCVALGMDAMRKGTALHYQNKGRLQIGIVKEAQRPALERVKAFFEQVHMPYSVEEDILHAMWGKFLLNVGINQACMVYETDYAGVLNTPEYFNTMSEAMHEVIAIAEKEGVHLTEEDYNNYVKILHTLDPKGYPSMRQDAVAKRKSEVELFSGTVRAIAAKHQISVPVNEFYYQQIQSMEAAY